MIVYAIYARGQLLTTAQKSPKGLLLDVSYWMLVKGSKAEVPHKSNSSFVIHHSSFIIRHLNKAPWMTACPAKRKALPVWFYRKNAKRADADSGRARLTSSLRSMWGPAGYLLMAPRAWLAQIRHRAALAPAHRLQGQFSIYKDIFNMPIVLIH